MFDNYTLRKLAIGRTSKRYLLLMQIHLHTPKTIKFLELMKMDGFMLPDARGIM